MELLLVTGFLGAGKTTFLGRLLSLWKDRRLALIVNEFGQANVDGKLLSDLGASLREVTGGSIFCSCRMDQFQAALTDTIQKNPDMILVEASGLSDPTAVRKVLAGFPGIAYKGCVALCDANRIEKTLATVRVCPKQLAVSDLILLNKADLVTEEEADRLTGLLAARFPRARIRKTEQAGFDPDWLETMTTQATLTDWADESRDVTLQKALVRVREGVPRADCEGFIRLVYEDAWRVKGLLRLSEGSFQVECVGPWMSITPCEELKTGNELVFLAGEGMPLRRSLQAARKWYPGFAEDVIFG